MIEPTIDDAAMRRFVELLMNWWADNKRSFSWRDQSDAYRQIVAEILLQKTRASAVEKVWDAFMNAFPNAEALANAQESDIAEVVQPLGLSGKRASYLRNLAAALVRDGFPKDLDGLVSLPGVGSYSAGAWLCLQGSSAPIVDANVRRVLGRYFLGVDKASTQHAAVVSKRLTELSDPEKVLLGLVDLGSSPCRPRNPLCSQCHLSDFCSWTSGRPVSGAKLAAV